jgi:hypothetical protein
MTVLDILISGLGWAAIAALWSLLILMLRKRLRDLRETPTVALVRRRHELTARLRQLAGNGDAELLRREARRLHAGAASIEVLEAAIEHAERISGRAAVRRPVA